MLTLLHAYRYLNLHIHKGYNCNLRIWENIIGSSGDVLGLCK